MPKSILEPKSIDKLSKIQLQIREQIEFLLKSSNLEFDNIFCKSRNPNIVSIRHAIIFVVFSDYDGLVSATKFGEIIGINRATINGTLNVYQNLDSRFELAKYNDLTKIQSFYKHKNLLTENKYKGIEILRHNNLFRVKKMKYKTSAEAKAFIDGLIYSK